MRTISLVAQNARAALSAAIRPTLVAAYVVILAAGSGGCHAKPSGALTITSLDEKSVLAPKFVTAAYLPVDPSTADIYLSDIPAARLADTKDALADASGSIIQLHLFLVPSAGDTPIDSTACNATIRHLLLTGRTPAGRPEAVGLYGGGGFVYPEGDIGDKSLSASIDQATHRLLRATTTFEDRLGPGTMSGEFLAMRDDALAKSIAAKLDALMRPLPPPAPLVEQDARVRPATKTPAAPKKRQSPEDKPPPVDVR